MHLMYVDESGKSGAKDFDQPFYVLGGLVIHENKWQAMEAALNKRIDALVPPPRLDGWELHMAHIHHRKGDFARMEPAKRFGLVDAVFDVLEQYAATLIFVGIDKKAHDGRYQHPDPVEDLAYRFLLERFNAYVGHQSDHLGLVVCDEQKQLEVPTRRAHSRYRQSGTGMMMIDNVIETPFFTPSHWSRMLQMRGASTASYWPRIERLLDGFPNYDGKGLKRFP